MRRGGEFVTQGAEVINCAVEDQGEAPVGRVHRLVAVGGIEDGEATHAERGIRSGGESLIVGPPVQHRGAHAGHGGGAGGGGGSRINESSYAAHGGEGVNKGILGELRPVASGKE